MSSEDRDLGIKFVYQCGSCGYSFFVEAEEPAAQPERERACPQCGSAGARFTFTLGSSCGCATPIG